MTFEICRSWIKEGQYNKIHKSVQFIGLGEKCGEVGPVVIGDCNTIHENVKIVVGEAGFKMGDWNTIHNGVFIMDDVQMGHNCWIGQGSHLDGRGRLRLGNGVSVAFHSHIWSHVARGPLLDGCTLYHQDRTTTLEDDVWLVGDNVHVSPGVTIAEKAIIFAHSVVTKDVRAGAVCVGNPSVERHDLHNHYWEPLDHVQKYNMMLAWVKEFVETRPQCSLFRCDRDEKEIAILEHVSGEILSFGFHTGIPFDSGSMPVTRFHLGRMTYTKRLTTLEREFYAFIKDYKARFVPGGFTI